MLRKLKGSAANSAKAAADPVQLSREQALRAARDDAELRLAAANVERKELEARVAELEGKPAERDHQARLNALNASTAKLQAAKERAAHEQELLKDEVAQKDRAIEQLEHRLRTAEHRANSHEEGATRLQSELGAAQLALAEERKERYVAEDRLRVANSRGESEAGRRAHAAEQQVKAMLAEGERRDVEYGKLRQQAELGQAEREGLMAQLEQAQKGASTSNTALAEARAELTLLRQALTGGSKLVVEDGPGPPDPAAEEEEESLSAMARRLRQQAAASELADAARAAAEAATREARRQAESALSKADVLEEQLQSVQLSLQASEAALDEMRRDKAVPVLDQSKELEQRDERLFELTMYRVPALEQQSADALAALARCEAKLAVEKEMKESAKAEAAGAKEALRTAEAAMALARDEQTNAEKAKSGAVEMAAALADKVSALEGELVALRQKETAYSLKEYDVSESVGTNDVAKSLLEEQARLLTISLQEEEGKVAARDEMLRSLQAELGSNRKRLGELEQRVAQARHLERKAENVKADAEAERNEMREKLSLAMMEVQARAERLEHSQMQVNASRGEIRSLENQLQIANNQLALVQSENSSLSQSEANKSAQLTAALASLRAKEGRLEAADRAVEQAREESAARRAELVTLAEQLGAAQEEKGLMEEQLTAASHRADLMQAQLEMSQMNERLAKNETNDEKMLRIAHEGRVMPLREALRQREADIADAEERNASRVLLVERLSTVEMQRVAEKEKASASEHRAAAAELKAKNADQRLEIVRAELGRREARISAMRTSLAAYEEELSLLKASKELLAARQQLQEELTKQRSSATTEEAAMQSALVMVKARQVEAADLLVRAAGKHAADAVSAVRDSATQAVEAEESAGAQFEERLGKAERMHARGEAEVSALHGRLKAARVEVEAAGERASQLASQLADERERAKRRDDELDSVQTQAFHNHCVLAKVLVHTKKRPANVLVGELYDEVKSKEVPISEWPNWVVHKMSGDSLSTWLR